MSSLLRRAPSPVLSEAACAYAVAMLAREPPVWQIRKTMMTHTLVKIGGSLYDLPDLAGRLGALLGRLHCARITLFPGGGLTTDAIRALDGLHNLGAESAHWLALRALTLNAFFLRKACCRSSRWLFGRSFARKTSMAILEPYAFALSPTSRNPDHLPHMLGSDQRFPGGARRACAGRSGVGSSQVGSALGSNDVACGRCRR